MMKPPAFSPGTRVKLIRDGKSRARDEHEGVRSSNTELGKQMALLLKMHEEIQEVAAQPDDVMEYADVLEALLELGWMHGIRLEDIIKAMDEKRARIGGFRKGLIFWRKGFYVESERN